MAKPKRPIAKNQTVTATQTTTQTKVITAVATAGIIAAAAAGFIGIGLDGQPFNPDNCPNGYAAVMWVEGYETSYFTPGYEYEIPGYAPGYVQQVSIPGYTPGYHIYDCLPNNDAPPGYFDVPGYNSANDAPFNIPGYQDASSGFIPHYQYNFTEKYYDYDSELRNTGWDIWEFFPTSTQEVFEEEIQIISNLNHFLLQEKQWLLEEQTKAEQKGRNYYEDASRDILDTINMIDEIYFQNSQELGWLTQELNKLVDGEYPAEEYVEEFVEEVSNTSEEQAWLQREVSWFNQNKFKLEQERNELYLDNGDNLDPDKLRQIEDDILWMDEEIFRSNSELDALFQVQR